MTTHKECLAHFVHFTLSSSKAIGYIAPSNFSQVELLAVCMYKTVQKREFCVCKSLGGPLTQFMRGKRSLLFIRLKLPLSPQSTTHIL